MRRPGDRLKEVRICFNKGGGLRACGRNEDQRRLCSAERMYVPPVRIAPSVRRRSVARARSGRSSRSRNRAATCCPDRAEIALNA